MSSLKNLVTSLWRMTQSRAQPLCARVTSCKREEGVFFLCKTSRVPCETGSNTFVVRLSTKAFSTCIANS